MFGQKTTFGAATTAGFGGTFGAAPAANPFGVGGTTSAFGQPQQQQPQSAFGTSAFGAATQPGAGGSLFGTPSSGMGGGLFGASSQPVTSTPSFGGFGAAAPGASRFSKQTHNIRAHTLYSRHSVTSLVR